MAGFPGSFGLPAASPLGGGVAGAAAPNIQALIGPQNWQLVMNYLKQHMPYLQNLGGHPPISSPGPGMRQQNFHPVNRTPITSPGPGMTVPPNFGPVHPPLSSPGPGMQNPILQALNGLRNLMPGINQ